MVQRLFLLVFSIFFSVNAWAMTQEQVAQRLVHCFKPEKMTVIMTNPDKNGHFPQFYLDLYNGHSEGGNISHFSFSAFDLEMNPIEQWTAREYPHILSMAQGSLLLELSKNDLQSFVQNKNFKEGLINDVKVDLDPGIVQLSAVFRLKDWLPDLRVNMDMQFEIRKGVELWINLKKVKTNGVPMPSWVLQKILNQMQPLVDARRYHLPFSLRPLKITEQSVTAHTELLPKKFDGDVWIYENGKLTHQSPTKNQ